MLASIHAKGRKKRVAATLREVVPQTCAEPGCIAISVCRSTRDAGLFWIHSRWIDEAAFEVHAEMPHTVRLIATVDKLIDDPLDITRTRAVA